MKGRDRKALDPILYFIHSYTHCTRIHFALPSYLPFIGISQRRLSAFPSLASLPPSPHSPTPSSITVQKMSVNLQPSNSLGFNRASLTSPRRLFSLPRLQGPLTQNVKRSISVTNPNADPVSFKIKTTAPKVRSSRVQFRLGLPVSQAVLRTAQLWQGRPRTDG